MAFTMQPLPRYAGLDALAVAVLTAGALSGFWNTFAGYDWLITAGAGLAIGLGWAYLFLALRLPAALVVLTLFLPYFLTAGGIALRAWGLFAGIPDGAVIGRVVKGTYGAWRQILETAPMLDSQGTVMLVPFLLAMACGGLCGALAVHTRRAATPAVPFLFVLALVLLMGSSEPLSVAVQGLGFGAAALLWIGHRSARNAAGREGGDSERTVPFGRAASATLVVLVAAALVAPLALSAPARSRWVLSEVITPIDTSSVTTPLTVFRSFRPGHNPDFAQAEVFHVTGAPQNARVRIAVLDAYDGERWYADPDASPDDFLDRFLRVSSHIDNPARGTPHRVTVSVEYAWLMDWLPVVGKVRSFDFVDDAGHFARDKVRYNRSTSTALLLGGLRVGDRYQLDSMVASDVLRPQMNPWPIPDAELQARAAFLDVPLKAWTAGPQRPMDQVFAMAARMKERGRYSDGDPGWQSRFTDGHDADKLLAGFINNSQMVGNDEQYAATMALLVNRMGIPARVVVGARVRKQGKVLGRDIGAWVEVRIADGSWRTLPNSYFMSRRPPTPAEVSIPKVELPAQQPQRPERRDEQDKEREREAEEQRERERAQERERPWWLLALVPVLLVGSVPLAKLVRRRRRSRAGAGLPLAGWAEVVDTAADLGLDLPVRPRPDQARALGLPLQLAAYADVAAFTDSRPPVDGDYWARVEQARRGLVERVPWWRRALAAVHPGSLLRRGTR